MDGLPDAALDPSSADGAHHVLEALKLALADRDAHYGSGIGPGVLDTLLSPDYAARRRALIDEAASHEFRPGDVAGHEPFRPPLREETDVDTTAGVGDPGAGLLPRHPAADDVAGTRRTLGAASG